MNEHTHIVYRLKKNTIYDVHITLTSPRLCLFWDGSISKEQLAVNTTMCAFLDYIDTYNIHTLIFYERNCVNSMLLFEEFSSWVASTTAPLFSLFLHFAQ